MHSSDGNQIDSDDQQPNRLVVTKAPLSWFFSTDAPPVRGVSPVIERLPLGSVPQKCECVARNYISTISRTLP